MGRVKVLNDTVVNQIAAGEVVERPASVVKELVENSIDADASSISVVIHNGGQQLIEVIDDGSGMSRDDALLAIERFGTSKIDSVDDLLLIRTHGFRGEALPSIASVSKFSLITRERNGAEEGVEIEIDGGKLIDVRSHSTAPGTRIKVQQLFYNVPARRRFLRSERTETGLIKAVMLDFAAAYPNRRFRLVSDGNEQLNTAPCETFAERAKELRIGGEAPLDIQGSFPVAGSEVRVEGALCQPLYAVGSSGKLRVLVNRRSVRSNVILRAVRDGYGTMCKPGKYPHGVIKLELPAEEVDVNVHPQKAEVRFRSSDVVYHSVVRSVANSISSRCDQSGEEAAPFRAPSYPGHSSGPAVFSGGVQRLSEALGSSAAGDRAADVVPAGFSFSSSQPAGGAEAGSFSPGSGQDSRWLRYRFVGQVLGCFLVMEGADEVALVDMHAAHERVTFYRLMEQYKKAAVVSQRLLIPETIEVPAEKSDAVCEMRKDLEGLGFEFETPDEGTLKVLAVPALLKDANPAALFSEILSLDEDPAWSGLIGEEIEAVIARIACHGSVRSGRELRPDEVYRLLESLDEAETAAYCPHGRPIIQMLSRNELEAMFGRIQ